MKRIFMVFTAIFFLIKAAPGQVNNTDESTFQAEGSLNETTWSGYLLHGLGIERTVRLGVSNDGWTRGEIEIENNNTPGASIFFKTASSGGGAISRMVIDKDGKVGIGTGSSILNARFTIHGQNLEFYSNSTENNLTMGRDVAQNFKFQVTDNHGFLDYNQDDDENGPHVLYIRNISGGTSSSNDIRLQTSGVDRLAIKANGNVGIGTTSPSAKLEVDGNIISEEVKVQVVNPPDYVFSPDYSLRSLEETKAYITENQHLPEVPSAKEMEANGIQLGKMNMLLLKKIEELTLYQIELLERLKIVEAKNTELEKKLKR